MQILKFSSLLRHLSLRTGLTALSLFIWGKHCPSSSSSYLYTQTQFSCTTTKNLELLPLSLPLPTILFIYWYQWLSCFLFLPNSYLPDIYLTLYPLLLTCTRHSFCPSMNSHRPRSQNISKRRTLNPEKDSTRKRLRSHVSLEKSS